MARAAGAGAATIRRRTDDGAGAFRHTDAVLPTGGAKLAAC
jgi:hypothetical protein